MIQNKLIIKVIKLIIKCHWLSYAIVHLKKVTQDYTKHPLTID